MFVLSDIARGERYGYQILSSLRDETGGRVDLKAGTLYPLLHKLENQGEIVSRWDESGGRDRKWYSLTPKGRARLVNETREWLSYAGCVRRALQHVVDSLSPPAPKGESVNV